MIPEPLQQWVISQADHCQTSGRQVEAAAADETTPDQRWVIEVLEHASRVAAEARRIELAVSAWAILGGHVTPTAVARATGITITAASSRAGSPKTRQILSEIWADQAWS